MANPFILIDHPCYRDHDTGGGMHPEVPGRIAAIRTCFEAGPFAAGMRVVAPRDISRAELLAIHDESYLFRLEEACLSGHISIDHNDNQICYDSFDVAQVSAAAGLTAIDLVERGETETIFCAVRPPGHHAERSTALGFCLLNNIAIAARYWQQAYGRRKVFIIDWDAHHGNGIQSAFEHDPEVYYASIHEHPTFSFPGTGFGDERGHGPGKGTTLNVPLPPGANDAMLLEVIESKIGPAIESFRPDALLVAAGFDGHQDDDMSGLCYSTGVYKTLGLMTRQWAKLFHGRVVSILEGGYHLESLAQSAEAYVDGLAGE
ncbi:MAG: histone deacetylase [Proteobacteria bacterium]|nr:histone deacetylase [Desulfobulbaceae bacterium]MBU4152443.1 histone deacetylase [Pseudomonadota bacterium]MDP2106063.1 histone deacetylase [Desulfobulbaceae bacterium]